MNGTTMLRILATMLVVLLVSPLPAPAQITTGTVAGSVKDAQGGDSTPPSSHWLSGYGARRSDGVLDNIYGARVVIRLQLLHSGRDS